MKLRQRIERMFLAVAAVVLLGSSAFATGEVGCAGLALTDGTGATLDNAIKCVLEKVAPTSMIGTMLTALVPILLIIWGLRGGFSVIKKMVAAMFSTVRRAS